MFKKLKIKFILMNMILLTTVFVGIFGSIYVITAISIERDTEMKLRSNMFAQQKPGIPKEGMDMSIILDIDSSNKLLGIFSKLNIDDWNINDVADEIMNSSNELGKIKINGENYSFLKQSFTNGARIVLINRNFQQDMLNNLLEVFIAVGLLSLIILFAISVYFTNKTIKPLEETFIKQKQFIADASHELRTPITVIKTNLSLLEENKSETVESQSKWIRYIDSQADRMSTLINEMLCLANLDINKSREFNKFNFSKLLNDTLLFFEVVIFEKGLILEEKIQNDIYINGDKEQIKKLISILVDNAMKYTNEHGKIEVFLGVDKNKAKLVIKNTGKGIEKENLDKIFERFYRVDSSRDRETGGYGLGLSIAKSIVEDHKGKIYAQSNIEKDTSFIVEIPLLYDKLDKI